MSKINDFISRFGFHTTPFTCEIGVREHFIHDIYRKPLDQLLGIIDKRMSAALIAPAGRYTI